MEKDRTRGERRAQTRRIGRRARRIEHDYHASSWGRCTCAASVGRFRKSKAFACRCSGKRPRAPKLAGSLHKSWEGYRTSTRLRIWNKRLARAWHDAVAANAILDCELPGGPLIGRRHARAW